ncbi:hypothetical protein D3C73_999980 [compost metagenome]
MATRSAPSDRAQAPIVTVAQSAQGSKGSNANIDGPQVSSRDVLREVPRIGELDDGNGKGGFRTQLSVRELQWKVSPNEVRRCMRKRPLG